MACSLFEETLMWTSYRYAIGRKTYVSSLAYEIPQHYYNKLSDERKQFTAEDIRKEIYNHLSFMPFDLEINRHYSNDDFNPLDVIFKFIKKENITSWEDFIKYRDIVYNVNTDEYKFTKVNESIRNAFSKYDLNSLICWETFASCFDIKNHKFHNGKEFFKTWKEKLIPADKPGYLKYAPFGYEEIWISLEDFLKRGEYCGYILGKEFIADA